MALLTDDQDIREVYLHTEYGGNGDYYLSLSEGDKRLNFRVSTSGGNAPTNVKLAIASLFRIMEDAGLNEQHNQSVTEKQQTGSQCFTEDDLYYGKNDPSLDDRDILEYLNNKANQYATDRAKKVLDVIDIKMNNAYASRDFYVRAGDREAINKYTYRIELLEELKEKLTDPKNLEV